MYKLLLSTGGITDLDKGITSRDMIVSSFYEEFSKIPECELSILDISSEDVDACVEKAPECDFMLIRLYTASPIIQNIGKFRSKVKKIVSFIEHPQAGMDYTVGYLKNMNPDLYIPFPYPERYMQDIEKEKAILLDGQGKGSRCILKEVTEWLEPLKEYKIYQLGGTPLADYVELIETTNYKDYMEKTKRMKFFIQTHAGSYEHSVVDMMGRGIEVLMFEPSLIPREMTNDLELRTYTNQEELLNLIKNPRKVDVKHKMTPMKEVTQMLHKRFLEWIE